MRTLVLYDGDCNFCKSIAAGLGVWDRRGRLRFEAIQGPVGDEQLGDLSPVERLAALHVVDEHGRRHSAGAALPPVFAALPGGRPLADALARAPKATDRAYQLVAGHREGISRFVPEAVKRWATNRLANPPTGD